MKTQFTNYLPRYTERALKINTIICYGAKVHWSESNKHNIQVAIYMLWHFLRVLTFRSVVTKIIPIF